MGISSNTKYAAVGGAGLTFLPDPNYEWNPDPEAKYKNSSS